MPRIDVPWVDPTEGETLLGTPSLRDVRAGAVDLVLAAPKSVSIYYAALRAGKRITDADRLLELHEAAVHTALGYLNREAAWARPSTPRPSWVFA